MAYVAAIATFALTAAATYMQYQQQANESKDRAKAETFQAENETRAADARRKQVQANARRMLESQASKAGAAGVEAYESGSLLENQTEAAGLAQYEADLAAYPHEVAASQHSFASRLFNRQADDLQGQSFLAAGLRGGAAGLSAYTSAGGFRGSSIATNSPYGPYSSGYRFAPG